MGSLNLKPQHNNLYRHFNVMIQWETSMNPKILRSLQALFSTQRLQVIKHHKQTKLLKMYKFQMMVVSASCSEFILKFSNQN